MMENMEPFRNGGSTESFNVERFAGSDPFGGNSSLQCSCSSTLSSRLSSQARSVSQSPIDVCSGIISPSPAINSLIDLHQKSVSCSIASLRNENGKPNFCCSGGGFQKYSAYYVENVDSVAAVCPYSRLLHHVGAHYYPRAFFDLCDHHAYPHGISSGSSFISHEQSAVGPNEHNMLLGSTFGFVVASENYSFIDKTIGSWIIDSGASFHMTSDPNLI